MLSPQLGLSSERLQRQEPTGLVDQLQQDPQQD